MLNYMVIVCESCPVDFCLWEDFFAGEDGRLRTFWDGSRLTRLCTGESCGPP